MIDAREVLASLRIPPDEEAEIQRLGAEIVGAMRDPKRFDGTVLKYEIPVGDTLDEQMETFRIACALQRRFQANYWMVFLEPFVDPAGKAQSLVHRLSFSIDALATRQSDKRENGHHAPSFLSGLVDLFGGYEDADPLPETVDLSILIGTYNRKDLLKRAIKSFRKAASGLSIEIVVCDGGSTDGSREWLARQPDVILVGERRLEGAVRAFNQAYTLSRGQFVANLNDDCVVHGQALREGVEHLRKNPQCGQVAFAFSGNGQPRRGINDIYGEGSPKAVPWGTTYANFGVARREAVEQAVKIQGGFWNPCYRTYAGDCELSAWLWKLGWTVDKRPDLYVEDVWAEDALREKNRGSSGAEAKRMYERWPAEAFKPDGPDPKVSSEELARFYAVRGEKVWAIAPKLIIEHDVSLVSAQACGFPLPEEEPRLRALAPRVRALDPVEGKFSQRAERLSSERLLHVGLCTAADPQAGLVRALRRFGDYREVRWFADYREDANARCEAVLKVAAEQKSTLVFIQTMQGAFDGAFVRKLREIADPSCVIVTWSGDVAYDHSPWNMDGHVELSRAVDVALHSSMSHVRILRAAGVHNAGYLQIGYDQEQYRPPLRAPNDRGPDGKMLPMTDEDVTAVTYGDWRSKYRSYDVAFLGSHYGGEDAFSSSVRWHDGALRDEVVAKMKEAFGWKFACHGKNWPMKGVREVQLSRAHEVYQRAKVGLSVSLMNDLECYSSDRLHRILGCGALALVKRFPGMGTWGLEDGVNCLVWDTAEEAVLRAKDCLGPEADAIRKAGAVLARENLTWDVRMSEMQMYVDAMREIRKTSKEDLQWR